MKTVIRNIFIISVLTLAFMACTQAEAQKKPVIPTVTLNNGVQMPVVGLGTMTLEDTTGIRSMVDAIELGYRLFDTAPVYNSEDEVGEAIRRSGIDRKDLFITSKLWIPDMGYESGKAAFERTLQKLGTDYLDLYLIHRPKGDIKGSWQAMEELYAAGKIRAIGVSNFTPEQLTELMTYAKVKPAVNQIESSPYFQELDMLDTLQRMGIQMEAWSPMAGGRNGIFTNPVLVEIGQNYGKTAAQVTMRWLYQLGQVSIPRTNNRAEMLENISIFDFELTEEQMQQIKALDMNTTQYPEWK